MQRKTDTQKLYKRETNSSRKRYMHYTYEVKEKWQEIKNLYPQTH